METDKLKSFERSLADKLQNILIQRVKIFVVFEFVEDFR